MEKGQIVDVVYLNFSILVTAFPTARSWRNWIVTA